MLKEIIYLLHNRQKKIYFFICRYVCKFSFGDVEYILILPALNAILNEEYF